MDLKQIMKQAQGLQNQLKKQQEALAAKEFEASAGGGMVTARVNGRGELLALAIEKEVVDPNDVGMLEDLVVAAVNEALKRVQEEQQDEMSSMMGNLGLKLPGL